jgi:heme-degrading monooxygenase HmoA
LVHTLSNRLQGDYVLMRVLRPRVLAKRWGEFAEHFRSAHIDTTPGLLGRWLVRDVDDSDTGFIVALWDREESERGYREQPEMRALTVPGVAGEFETHLFEVRAFRCKGAL